ncbi:intermediate filament protein-like protein [Patellaria atrata CBS 101060]|uniref:Intermediate filament protein-like protein n=1 Tax=Patellaria atrata CBS 101060 TaxID=1346257 RepID=A0A9P4SIH0_9PEZI|nr:intermediate filament protein-like protein [Patellaria atrata CBS 101060]
MALRRRDVILAGIITFISWGFVTHWVPSFRWLPYAFSAGVLATVTGFLWIILSISQNPNKPETKNAQRPRNVAFVASQSWQAETAALKRRGQYHKEPLYPPSLAISDSIEALIELIFRDFIVSWYMNISNRPTFTNEVDRAVRAALGSILERIRALDLVEVTVSRLAPIITQHMKEFYIAERAVRGRKLSRNVTESEELDLAIAGKYRNGQLHPAASLTYSNTKLIQQHHLRSIVTRLIPKVLPHTMTTSASVTVLIKEIVSCAVLFPSIQMLIDPDTWNQLMEAYGRNMLQERKTVRKLRQALDEHTPASPKAIKPIALPRLAPGDNERKFERFVRAIRQCNTLSDARRFRNEVASQLRKGSSVEGQDVIYLRRLETAKRILDQKVTTLGAGSTNPKLTVQPPVKLNRTGSRFENASLKDVLHDASGLSYFMEYMDRQKLMSLVQFWIVVDGFRNPLEDETDKPDENTGIQHRWTEADKNDLAQINEAYLNKLELKVDPEARRLVKEFLKAGSAATTAQYLRARRVILRAQSAIYEEMQEHYERFKKSDLYYKWSALDEAPGGPPSPTKSIETLEDRSPSPIAKRPAKVSRLSTSKLTLKPPDLRRAVVSSSDLRSTVRPNDDIMQSRRSLDDSSRAPLFDDDYDSDVLARSTQSLGSEGEAPRINANNKEVVDAMQAALNDIMDHKPDEESLFSDSGLKSPQEDESLRGSMDIQRPDSPISKKDRGKPSIASLGLVSSPRRGFFNDDLFGEEEKFLEDEHEDSDVNEKTEEDEIHEAAPGDLGLAEAIDSLTADIERLVSQEAIVDSLTKKAELTNNAAELRILRKSKASLQREIHRKELQRQQYIVQESDNSLYGRATISIKSVMVANDDEGREIAMYVIEVQRQAGDQMPAAAWVIARRYSEFHELNKRLKTRYPAVRTFDFPRRQVVFKLQKDFLEKRRQALEKYLRELLQIPAICRSLELRAFLSQQTITAADNDPNNPGSQQRDFVTRIYDSVTDGMEEFLGNIPVLDQLSLAGQNLISAATSQLNTSAAVSPTTATSVGIAPNDAAAAAEVEAELNAFTGTATDGAALEEPFVKPICDLFLEAFELNRESNWLRGRAVVVVLHQLLGGTIERKVRETFSLFTREDKVVEVLDSLRESLWPGGGKIREQAVRTEQEKKRSRREAGLVLATLVPEVAGSVVGRGNAQSASRRIAATLNNRRLK